MPSRFVLLAATVAALGGLLFGYDTGVIAGAILFIKREFAMSTQLQEFVISIVLLGCMLGAGSAGPLADRYGRRPTLLAAGVIFGLGALASSFAPNVACLLVARFIVGTAIGFASVVSPLYVSEVSPAKFRGGLVSLYQFAITVGILVAFVIDYLLANSGDWRLMLGLALLPSIALIAGMLAMPESPRFLFKQGRTAGAHAEFLRIYGNAEQARDEEQAIAEGIRSRGASLRSLFGQRDVRYALFVGISLAILQQVTEIGRAHV